jgi:hypothetical protein
MTNALQRCLVIQSDLELASYTCSLLDKIGYRHILNAHSITQAKNLIANLRESQEKIDLIVMDDAVDEGAIALKEFLKTIPTIIISSENAQNNLNLTAHFKLNQIIFKPYGRKQIEKCMLLLN